MNIIPPVEIIFFIIGAIFLAIGMRDYYKSEKKRSIACKVRLRMAAIFIVVGIGLFMLRNFIWN